MEIPNTVSGKGEEEGEREEGGVEGGGRRGKRGRGRGRKEGVNESVYAVCVRYKINVQVHVHSLHEDPRHHQ